MVKDGNPYFNDDDDVDDDDDGGGDDDDDGPSIVLGFCNTDKLILGSCIKRLHLPTHPPCYMIVEKASSQDNGVSSIRNPACVSSAVA